MLPAAAPVSAELLAPMDAPEVPDAPVAPAAEPVPEAAPLLPVAVPVVPMGVFCVLCCPAPVAGLGLAVVGGLPWATAVPTTAMVARPASKDFNALDAFMSGLLDE